MSSSPLLARGPSDCCFTGIKHTGDPAGSMTTFADVPTYISEPPSAQERKKIIFFFADIWGPLFVNNKLIQDYFASRGYTVLGPDYFLGDPVQNHNGEEGFDRQVWFQKARKQTVEILPRWIQAVKEKYGTSDVRYFGVGYCFGAPFVLDVASDTGLLSAAAFAHPTYVTEDQFRNLNVPLFLSCAETDSVFPAEARRRAEDILVEKKKVYHIQTFSGVSHGFAVRGDPNVEHERWAKETSAKGIIGWFNRFSETGSKL